MKTLSAMFLRELTETDHPCEPSARAETDPALEANLAAACARGRAAFGTLVLDDQTFTRHLARTIKLAGANPSSLSTLAIEDLFLACACLAGVEGAAAAFSARHGATIRGTIARIVRGADNGEVEQQLVAGLLVGSVAGPARIGSYAGKAPLDRWLGVAAQRAALMWLRENRTEARARDGAAAEPAASGDTHPEMAFLKDRYRGDFEQALKESLARLPERATNVAPPSSRERCQRRKDRTDVRGEPTNGFALVGGGAGDPARRHQVDAREPARRLLGRAGVTGGDGREPARSQSFDAPPTALTAFPPWRRLGRGSPNGSPSARNTRRVASEFMYDE